MGYRMLGALPLIRAAAPASKTPTTVKSSVMLMQPTLSPTNADSATRTLYAVKPVPVEAATPVIVESPKVPLPVRDPFVYDAATNPKT